jgi:DNA-binding SARP family transcriptional activator/nucleoid-associated protein YgaU
MNQPQRTDIGRGVISLVGLLALLVAPPVLLILLVGWPLPTAIPRWDEVQTSLTIGLRNEVIVKGLALATWLLWLYVATSIVLATVAEIRGRAARRLPVLPRLQQQVGHLVATTYLAFTTLGSGSVAASSLVTIPAVQVIDLSAPDDVVSSISPSPPVRDRTLATTAAAVVEPAIVAPAAAGGAIATVETGRHDSYWALAERVLGDGLRWHEIRDINVGRTMSDGHTITPADDVVRPGWRLLVPGPDQQAPADPTDAPTVTVQPGDNLWDLAESHLNASIGRQHSADEVAPYWLQFVDENSDRFADPSNPDLIYPGQEFIYPAISHPGAAAPEMVLPVEVVSTPTAPVTACPSAAADVASEVEDSNEVEVIPSPTTTADHQPPDPEAAAQRAHHEPDADDDDSVIGVVTVVGAVGTALAVGVIRELRRRRRIRNHRHPHTLPSAEEPSSVQREITALADEDAQDGLRTGLDQLAAAVATKGLPSRPLVIQHGPDNLEVLWDRAAGPAPDGWETRAAGAVWARAPEGLVADRLQATPHGEPATPLLVQLGQPEDEQQVYLDLETARVVSLSGEKAVADGLLRAIATELAFSRLAEGVDVLLVGDVGIDVDRLDRITAVGSWVEAAREVVIWAQQSRDALAAQGWPNPFVARGFRSQDDALRPLVVLASEPPDDKDVLDDLLVGSPSSVAAVVYGRAVDGATLVECRPDEIRLPQLDLTLRPAPLDPEVVAEVVELLDEAEESVGEPYELFPDDPEEQEGSPGPAEVSTKYEDPDHDVRVCLLGDLTVEGIGEPLTGRQLAVVAYLALHRTVSLDQLEDAIWATEADGSHRKRLGNLVAECRNRVGRDHIPGAVDGHYTVGPRILADVDLFERRVRSAAKQPQGTAAETLAGALGLVRGPIFKYRSADQAAFAWVDLEHWVATWEQKITGVAQHLAEIYLDSGDADGAIAVAEQVLRVVPTHSAVTETLMRAHASKGDRHAIRRVYAAHVRALDHLDLDAPADTTTAAYHELLKMSGES